MSDSRDLFIRLRSITTGEWLAPPELREKLVADAQDHGTNLTEVAVVILARSLKVPYEPVGRKANPGLDSDVLKLNIPADLDQALRFSAAGANLTRQRAALTLLCAHYGLRMVAPVKRGRRRRVAA